MRRGKDAAVCAVGGAWLCTATTLCTADLRSGTACTLVTMANTTHAGAEPCEEDGCTKGTCAEGVSLQQSWLCW